MLQHMIYYDMTILRDVPVILWKTYLLLLIAKKNVEKLYLTL